MALICAAMKEGTHCLIEWDELNNPVSIVDRKNVKSVDVDSEPDVGEMCSVRCRERSRWVEYPGKLLAIGSKKEMELELARLDNLGSSDNEDEEGAQATSQAAKTVSKDTHCLIEWDEPNTPVSIVERMDVKSVDGDSEPNVGDMCLVRCRERSRWVEYPGKLLAIGSKKEMKQETTQDRESAQTSSEVVSKTGGVDTAGDAEKMISKGGELEVDMAKEDNNGESEDSDGASSGHHSGRGSSNLTSAKGGLQDQQPAKKKRQAVTRKVCKKRANAAEDDGNKPGDEQPPKKRRQIAIASKPSKKKAATENMRVTEQLLDGLIESSEKSPPRSPFKGFNTSLGDGYLSDLDEPELTTSLMPKRGQSTLQLKDLTNKVVSTPQLKDLTNKVVSTPQLKDLTNKGTSFGWECSVQAQLENLKLWLELQFAMLNRKVDDIAEDVKSRRRHKKVHQDATVEGGRSDFDDKSVHEESIVAGNSSSAEPSIAGQSAAGPVKTGKLEVVCGNPKSKQHLLLPLPSEAAVALFHSVNCCLPPDAGTFAKKLLDIFFSEEELARLCCTKATGRELLNQTVLLGIKYQTFYKYKEQIDEKWSKIVREKLNMRCRTCRRKLENINN